LSERAEDIIPLARHFLRDLTPGKEPLDLDEPVREYIQTRHYRGNVRELRQLISRMGQRHVGNGPITAGDLPEDDRPSTLSEVEDWRDEQFERAVRRALTFGAGLRDISQAAADAAIDIAVSEEGGNLQRAARRLGVTDRALQMRRAHRRVT
jgi:DNA-binding NtrC family response regulator